MSRAWLACSVLSERLALGSFYLCSVACAVCMAAACTTRCPQGRHFVAGQCTPLSSNADASESVETEAANRVSTVDGAAGQTAQGTEAKSASGSAISGSSAPMNVTAKPNQPGSTPAGTMPNNSAMTSRSAANAGASAPAASAAGPCPNGASPELETCDGLDNDCDMQIDESLQQACGSSMQGICRMGEQVCSAGAWGDCVGAVEPMDEVCDAESQDENCNGAVNEGCACASGDVRPCGQMGGACQMGQQTCTDGAWSEECVGEVKPTKEVCDGRDDEDCDGQPDTNDSDCECVDGMSEACIAGMGICADGMRSCSGGKWGLCKGPAPSREVCDGEPIDEDCDGSPNNGCDCTNGMTQMCPGGVDVGACKSGMQTCSNGKWSQCVGAVKKTQEKCDGIDSDCDGVADASELGLCQSGRPCISMGSEMACAACQPSTLECVGADLVTCSSTGTATMQRCTGNIADCKMCPEHDSAWCKRTADHYGVKADVDWGFAPNTPPNLVRNTWVDNNCHAQSSTPLHTLCVNAATDFGIIHNQTFGTAPQEVQDWWKAQGCDVCPGDSKPCPPE